MRLRPPLRRFWLLLLLCPPLCRAGLAQAAPEDPLAGDPRLDRKVIVTAEGLPAGDLLTLISRETGVALSASREVADDKVMLFGPPRPVREVLADLAALLGNRWERTPASGYPAPGGGLRYTLFRDPRTRRQEARLEQAAAALLLARMEEQVRALEEAPEQLARRPANDPIRRQLSDPRGRLGTAFYARLSRSQREALFTRQRVYIPYEALTAQQKEELRAASGMIIQEEEKLAELARGQGFNLPVSKAEDLGRNGLRFVLRHAGFTQVMVDLSPTLNGSLNGSLLAALIDSRSRWLLPPHGDPYTGKPVPENAPLPSPEAVRAASGEKAWPDRLRRLAAESGRPVLADYYRSKPLAQPVFEPPAPFPGEAAAALDTLCKPPGCLWWMRGRTLLLRRRDWYTQRRYEVPDRWLLRTIARLNARGGLPTWGDVGRAAELTPEQLAGLESFQGPHGGFEQFRLPALRVLLAIVGAAPRAEETPLPAGPLSRETLEPLTYAVLTPAQRRLLPALTAEEERPLPPEKIPGFGAFLLCPREQTVVVEGDYRCVEVVLTWGFETQPRAMQYRNRSSLYLPASLPGDRRDRTKVKVVP